MPPVPLVESVPQTVQDLDDLRPLRQNPFVMLDEGFALPLVDMTPASLVEPPPVEPPVAKHFVLHG